MASLGHVSIPFHLEQMGDVKKFLIQAGPKTVLEEGVDRARAFCYRISHFLSTHTWINEDACVTYCVKNGLQNQRTVQEIFSQNVARKTFAHGKLEERSLYAAAKDACAFVHQFIRAPYKIGAIAPSSSFLAATITSRIPDFDANDGPRRYLEIGPGTGVFTNAIIQKLKATDHLDLVEFDPEMCKILREKYRHFPNITVHQVSITEFNPRRQYDVVISGLPLNGFTPEFVEEIMQKYVALTKKDGHLSYFEYIGMPQIRKVFLPQQEREKLDQVLAMKGEFTKRFGEGADHVLLNIPPARAVHCHIKK